MTVKHSVEYVQNVLSLDGYILDNKYVGSRDCLEFHDFDGYRYFLSFDKYMTSKKSGYHPHKFSKKNPFTVYNIKLWLANNKSEILLSSDFYTEARARNMIFTCRKCKKQWISSWNDMYEGRSCPNCQQSLGESIIDNYLNKNNIRYEYQKRFKDCKIKGQLPFDFYIIDFNLCIEFQGIQHYKPIDFSGRGKEMAIIEFDKSKIRDSYKKEYCIKNNISFIEISYFEIDKIEEILNKVFN